MATVYSYPKGLGAPPDITPGPRYDPDDPDAWRKTHKEHLDRYIRDTEAWVEGVQAWAREHGSGPVRGEIVRFPVADGYAQYVVMSGTELIHLPVYDGWHIPDAHARGLRASDIKGLVESERRLAELFGRKAEDPASPRRTSK